MKTVGSRFKKQVFGLIIMTFLFSSFSIFTHAADKITLNKKKLTMIQYKTYELNLKNADETIQWRSTDKTVAKVNSKGKITAVADGSCEIIASYKKKNYVCKVTVKGVKLSDEELSLNMGNTVSLELCNTSRKISDIKWKTSDKTIAKVNKYGKVKAVGIGTCKISVTYKKKKYICKITVDGKDVSLNETNWNTTKNKSTFLYLQNIGGKPVWSSSDTSIAVVSQDGHVESKNIGDCIITASYNNKLYKCTVKVRYPFNKTDQILLIGSSSMDYWRNSGCAGGYTDQNCFTCGIKNTAKAGSMVNDWKTNDWMNNKILNNSPKAVAIYIGANDIGDSSDLNYGLNTVAENIISFLNSLKTKLPGVPLYYISISPCYYRPNAWATIAACNKKVKEACDKIEDIYYIDVASKFVKTDGSPNEALFLSDKLHPGPEGYKIWKSLVAERIQKDLLY